MALQLQLYYIMIFITYLTPIVETNMTKFSQLNDLEKYIQTIYLSQRNHRHAYFQIQYINIIFDGDSNEILREFHHKKKLNQ